MAGLRFITNLRPQSISSFEGAAFQPSAWLLSTHRLTGETQRYASAVRDAGADLYADNGTKPLIDTVAALHRLEAAPIRNEWSQLRKANSTASPPSGLRDQARTLAARICDDVDAILNSRPVDDVVLEQAVMRPTHVFAQEDFAIAVLSMLGLERELLEWGTEKYTARNERSLRRWRRTREAVRLRGTVVFAVLSAVDHATARSAARLAARYGVDAIAYGFAGPNSNTSWEDSVVVDRKVITLPMNAPVRYTRIPAILSGFRDGMKAGGGTLRYFHALGCGAAPQFPALVVSLPAWTRVSTDATSPIMDAVEDLTAYHFDPAQWADRISVREGAQSVLTGSDWTCACPFCSYIRARFGWSPANARKAWQTSGETTIRTDHLHPDGLLGSHIPIFATSRDSASGPMSRSRIGHNHAIYEAICASIPDRQRRTWAERTITQLASQRDGAVRAGLLGIAAVHEALT